MGTVLWFRVLATLVLLIGAAYTHRLDCVSPLERCTGGAIGLIVVVCLVAHFRYKPYTASTRRSGETCSCVRVAIYNGAHVVARDSRVYPMLIGAVMSLFAVSAAAEHYFCATSTAMYTLGASVLWAMLMLGTPPDPTYSSVVNPPRSHSPIEPQAAVGMIPAETTNGWGSDTSI